MTSVLRENVILEENQAVIPLWTRWDAVLELVHALGPVLSIGRNSHAVLGRIGFYPKVFCAPCGHCASAADGTMEFYFGAWDHARVTVGEKAGGWLYGVEFFDAWKETLHKICLTADSDLEAFREWVELNQATPESSLSDRPGDRGGCSANPVPPPGEGSDLLGAGALEALFAHLMEEKQPVQVVVGNEHFVQGADLAPRAVRTTGPWVFVSDEKTGLHLRTGQMAEICRQRVFWQDDASALVLKVFEPEGRMACVLAPPRETAVPDWDDLVRDATEPFLLTKNQP